MKIMRCHHGFSLVEVALALGVMAFCLTTLFGLLPLGLANNQSTVEQTGAGNVATSVASDLFATALSKTASALYGFDLTSTSGTPQTMFFTEDANPMGTVGNSTATGSSRVPAHYRACVAFYSGGQNKATSARILVTWPAAADPSPDGLPKNYTGSFEAVVALNRN